MRYDQSTIQRLRELRSQGLSYTEIQEAMGMRVPKGSMHYLVKGIELTTEQKARLKKREAEHLPLARAEALIANRIKLDIQVMEYRVANAGLVDFMRDRQAKMVALAILYLGEGAKYEGYRGLQLGSTSPDIIKLFMGLVMECYGISLERFRARIQHRADQDPAALTTYWSQVSGLKKEFFYPPYIDKRTIGKPTLKRNYKGVCMISTAGTHAQLELSQIAGIIVESI